MPRPKLADPPIEITASVPTSLLARVDLYLFDPLRGKVAYGARTKLITRLLKRWVEEREAQAQPQAQGDSS